MLTNLSLFPLPYILGNEIFDGSIIPHPVQCMKCKTKVCEIAQSDELSLCSYGFNYQRLSKDITVCGFLLREWPVLSPARKKNLNQLKGLWISRKQYDSAVNSLKRDFNSAQQEIEKEKSEIIQTYVQQEEYKIDYLKSMRPHIIEGLSFVHDYKQINAQIAQNINVIIESKYEGDGIEEKLEHATQQEKAIYMASKLLEEKLNVAKLLVNPERINKQSDFKKFRFHGLLIKYRRIYTPYIQKKKIDLQLIGQSYHDIIAHPDAVAVIPHTFIDNAIKYSPKQGEGIIKITVQDQTDYIDFSVASYGPRILPDEKDRIFQPFYRGIAAKKQEEEGAGYGLYISQLIAKEHLGSLIHFEQDETQKPRLGHWTIFSIKIPLKAKILTL